MGGPQDVWPAVWGTAREQRGYNAPPFPQASLPPQETREAWPIVAVLCASSLRSHSDRGGIHARGQYALPSASCQR